MVASIPDEKDLNELYEDALYVLKTKGPKVKKKVDNSQQQEDYYRNFRTKSVFSVLSAFGGNFGVDDRYLCSVLLAWVLSNSLFAALITGTNPRPSASGADAAVSGYMTFLLYSVALFACKSMVRVRSFFIQVDNENKTNSGQSEWFCALHDPLAIYRGVNN